MVETATAQKSTTGSESAAPVRKGPLQTDKGSTTIAETVVQKLAGVATREVPGVFAMGNAARRAFNQITERIPGSQTNVSGGVSVEKGERQAAIDVSIVVEYGSSIVEVSEATSPQRSTANHSPQRPKPAITSSAIMTIPNSSQISRTPAR